jgi:hypothetical protein
MQVDSNSVRHCLPPRFHASLGNTWVIHSFILFKKLKLVDNPDVDSRQRNNF